MIEKGINVLWCLIGLGTMANGYSLGLTGPSGPDSGLFPFLCGTLITICGIVLMAGGDGMRTMNPQWPSGAKLARIGGVVAGLVAMAALLPYLGFAITGAITTFILLQTVERSRPVESVVLTVGSIVIVMYVFGHLLGMNLPRGPWGW
jgi:putative tricarboxylic transport membrane protein